MDNSKSRVGGWEGKEGMHGKQSSFADATADLRL